jgi:hypothetical protein
MTLARRSFITGLISLVAAPAIIRAGSLMSVKVMLVEAEPIWTPYGTAPNFEAARRLMNYRNDIMREYLRDNLFQPYRG